MTVVPGGGPRIGPTPLGAVRRTSTLVIEPRGDWADGQAVTATGRDLVRSFDGDVRADHDDLTADIDAAGLLIARGDRTVPAQLQGHSVRRGLRKRVVELHRARQGRGDDVLGPVGGLLDAMLDDLVGAALASGYGRLLEQPAVHTADLATQMSSTCLGFAAMNAQGERFDVGRYLAGKQASADFVPDDALAWHGDRPVRPRAFRRRRLLQVTPRADTDDTVDVVGYFRDTFAGSDGIETVVHEYGLDAVVSGPSLTLVSVEASPGLLPLGHCPLAAGTALSLVGLPLSDVETVVRRDISGPAGCTHLNDELRNLRLVPALLDLIVPAAARDVRSARTPR